MLYTNPTLVTGLTLIEKVLEFERMTHDRSKWSFNAQANNPPRLLRLRQLEVLLQVFTPEIYDAENMADGIDNLLEGQFLLKRKNSVYLPLFNRMYAALQSIRKPPFGGPDDWTCQHLSYNFQSLVEFKRLIDQLMQSNKDVKEASYPYYYSIKLTNDILAKLDTTLLDEFLSLAVDPLQRTFSMETLVKDYGYPKEDTLDVDLDYW